MGPTSTGRLDALTGLRFFAALGVALTHMPYLRTDDALGRIARRFVEEGGVGVPFFFVLSGFVLAFAYHRRLSAPDAVRGYAISRLARIAPLHLLTFLIAAALPYGPTASGGGAIANALLLQSWVPDVVTLSSFNSVSWTLSIEVFFYAAFPFLLLRFVRRKPSKAALLGGTVAVWLLILGWVTVVRAATDGFTTLYVAAIFPPARLGEFVIGMLLGLMHARRRVRRPRAPSRHGTLREIAVVAILVGLVAFSHRVGLVYRLNGYYTPALALVVLVFARERGWLSRFVASRGVVALGERSFTLFMVRALVFAHVCDTVWSGAPPIARAMLSLATALAVAAVVYHGFELPARTAVLWLFSPSKRTIDTPTTWVFAGRTRRGRKMTPMEVEHKEKVAASGR